MNEEKTTTTALWISEKMAEIPPFLAMEIFEHARRLEEQGRHIVHLEVGEPDFDTPKVVCDAGVQAIQQGFTHYTPSLGRIELREAVAEFYKMEYGVEIAPERVVITQGSSAALVLTFAMLLDPGSEVLMTNPCYACYPKIVRVFEGRPRKVPVRERDGFQWTPQALAGNLTDQTRIVVINSPSNPTGTLLSAERLRQIVEIAEGKAMILSDEIYHGLVYSEKARSILEFSEDAVVVSGFSKRFAMTGWRLGYAILPEPLIRPFQSLQQNLYVSPQDFAQFAGIAALRNSLPEVEEMRREYDRRRRFVLEALKKLGLEPVVEPLGAFYVFVNIARFTDSVYDFCIELLETAGVAVTPGTDFGSEGEGFIRIAYTQSMEDLEEGFRRIREYLTARGGV
jgi:(5-formylfuran-3-yl)methyl phosphate transaminase